MFQNYGLLVEIGTHFLVGFTLRFPVPQKSPAWFSDIPGLVNLHKTDGKITMLWMGKSVNSLFRLGHGFKFAFCMFSRPGIKNSSQAGQSMLENACSSCSPGRSSECGCPAHQTARWLLGSLGSTGSAGFFAGLESELAVFFAVIFTMNLVFSCKNYHLVI